MKLHLSPFTRLISITPQLDQIVVASEKLIDPDQFSHLVLGLVDDFGVWSHHFQLEIDWMLVDLKEVLLVLIFDWERFDFVLIFLPVDRIPSSPSRGPSMGCEWFRTRLRRRKVCPP